MFLEWNFYPAKTAREVRSTQPISRKTLFQTQAKRTPELPKHLCELLCTREGIGVNPEPQVESPSSLVYARPSPSCENQRSDTYPGYPFPYHDLPRYLPQFIFSKPVDYISFKLSPEYKVPRGYFQVTSHPQSIIKGRLDILHVH